MNNKNGFITFSWKSLSIPWFLLALSAKSPNIRHSSRLPNSWYISLGVSYVSKEIHYIIDYGLLSCKKLNLIPIVFIEFLLLVGLSKATSFVSLLLSEGSADGVKCSEYSSSIFGRISCNILKYILFSVLDASFK